MLCADFPCSCKTERKWCALRILIIVCISHSGSLISDVKSHCGQLVRDLHWCSTHCHASTVTNSILLTLGHCWLLTGALFVTENVVQTSLALPRTTPTPWSFLTCWNLLLAGPRWYQIPSPYCPTASQMQQQQNWLYVDHRAALRKCVYSLSSKCQESALSRRSPARWMFNESQSFYNCPHKHIFKQVDQQRVSPEALKKGKCRKVFLQSYVCFLVYIPGPARLCFDD